MELVLSRCSNSAIRRSNDSNRARTACWASGGTVCHSGSGIGDGSLMAPGIGNTLGSCNTRPLNAYRPDHPPEVASVATAPTVMNTDRLAGTLLGTALGDALGLPAEGMSAAAIARRFGRVDRFRLLGRTGYVSDDTEQAALVAQALARYPDDPEECVRDFRRSMLGWFCRLPFGVGLGTVRACTRIALGLSSSGVMAAGNGAAMRAAIVGVFFRDHPERRHAVGRALAEVTHRNVGVQGPGVA